MKRIKVKMSWARETVLKKAAFARGTVTAMTSNALFATPAIAMAAMLAAATRAETAWANRKNGSVARDELENATLDLEAKLYTQAEYVEGVAQGNDNIIHSAGFVSTQPSNAGLQRTIGEAPAAPIVASMAGGSIKVSCDAVPGTKTYCFVLIVDGNFNAINNSNNQLAIASNAAVFIINSTKHSVTFNSLPALKTIQVAVAVVNSAGTSAFSAVAQGSTLV